MLLSRAFISVCLAGTAGLANMASAQTGPAHIAQAANLTVGLIGGVAGSTDARIAADLAETLDDGDRLRVLAIQGNGSEQNIADLIFLHGIDLAIVHSDTLTQTMQDNAIPRENSVRYIANLFQEEVHVLARQEITSLAELNGVLVETDRPASDAETTATTLFDALHIHAQFQHDSNTIALERLRRGTVSALVIVGGQPVPLLQTLDAGSGLHFLPIPLNAALLDTYLPTKLDHQRYPNLVPADYPVATVAVGAVLLTVPAHGNSPRASRVNRFVDSLFERFDRLRQPGHHPKWQEVNLAAKIPGLTRYAEAQALLDRSASTVSLVRH